MRKSVKILDKILRQRGSELLNPDIGDVVFAVRNGEDAEVTQFLYARKQILSDGSEYFKSSTFQ
jgi:hypothetical protein